MKAEVELKEHVDLIEAVLVDLGHADCPYCGCNIKLDNFVSREDIEKWLKEKEDK